MGDKVRNNIDLPEKILVNFFRVLLGLTFMFSGIVKAIDPMGTQIKLSDYLYAFGMGGVMLDSTLLIFACLLAGFEIIIGTYLTMGTYGKGTSLITLILMSVLTPFTLVVALTNPVEDCGCFGDALILTNWETFYKNMLLLGFAVYLFICRKKIVPFVASRRHWIVTVVIVAITVRFLIGNVLGLPVIDFRPYKVGTDLKQQIVSRNPEFSDFSLMDDEMGDITMDILNDSVYTFLLVSPHVEDASDSYLDLIDDIFDYCGHWGYNMIGVTASGDEAIRKWIENAGAEFRFVFCDEVPLQTMVRSNPGLVLLKDGVIVNKWSHSQIPSDEVLNAPLSEISVGRVPDPDPLRTPWAIAMLFGLPLLLTVGLDLTVRLKQ